MSDHVIVVDLGYGDSGKGTVVDWLCSAGAARAVVRFNGGAQAAHNVVTPGGRHHTFAQFGSGMFTPGVRTHLSRFMLVDPLALAAEAAHLESVGVPGPLDRLTVDPDALLTTPYHRAANQARELARPAGGRHGSCGMGIGETARYALEHPAQAPRAGDCTAPRTLAAKLGLLRDWLAAQIGEMNAERAGNVAAVPPVDAICAAYRAFAGRVTLAGGDYLAGLLRDGPVAFEGAQGVLLDERHGFHPYTTWSNTTFGNALELLAEAGASAVRLGVTRCYQTRHGPGPLVTEDPTLELADRHNVGNRWQGPFRVGHFDAVALRYAIGAAGGIDEIALTHLDAASLAPLRACESYLADGAPLAALPLCRDRDLARQERLTRLLLRAAPGRTRQVDDWPGYVSDALRAPVTLLSAGPTSADKVSLRRARDAGLYAGRA